MTPQTQTDTEHGNCWQTAWACVLDVPAAALPDQVAIEQAGGSYNNALRRYLMGHHRAALVQLYSHEIRGVEVTSCGGHHLIVGPTERTPRNGGKHHVVVACRGAVVWDPHPSRAGLVSVGTWEYLSPDPPDEYLRHWLDRFDCLCPACGGAP